MHSVKTCHWSKEGGAHLLSGVQALLAETGQAVQRRHLIGPARRHGRIGTPITRQPSIYARQQVLPRDL